MRRLNGLRSFFYKLSPKMRFTVRRLYYWPYDTVQRLMGKSDPEIPPKGLIFTGEGDFKQQGDHLLSLFIQEGGLKPDHHVLDVGCGIGRIARPIIHFISESGSYAGFDAIKLGINWCQRHLKNGHGNVSFKYIPIKNDLYRNDGQEAANFIFPYKNGLFDFVTVISVFTHMQPDEVINYLEQIFLKLKPGGRCFATFFLIKQKNGSEKPNYNFQFPFDFGHYVLMNQQVTNANVGYKTGYLKNKIEGIGFRVVKEIPGYWRNGIESEDRLFQDILILEK